MSILTLNSLTERVTVPMTTASAPAPDEPQSGCWATSSGRAGAPNDAVLERGTSEYSRSKSKSAQSTSDSSLLSAAASASPLGTTKSATASTVRFVVELRVTESSACCGGAVCCAVATTSRVATGTAIVANAATAAPINAVRT